MILNTNKNYPNALNIKAQTKGLSIEQLNSSLGIKWFREKSENETIEEDLRRQLKGEILEKVKRRKDKKSR